MIELEILKLRIVPQQGKNTVKLMKNLKINGTQNLGGSLINADSRR
jgi:hypothetical protein